ncbi:MAG: hypothetical protein RQ952_02765 [Thermoproteota archaeon]|jgi:fumarate reductase subunit D|nr:hypothetical protein [Thermoproteota archaeon]
MSRSHAITWALFAATATIAALLFPALLFYLEIMQYFGYDITRLINQIINNIIFRVIFFIIIASGIYHGFYRFKAILQEQVPKFENQIEILMLGIAIIFIIIALYVTIII